MMMMMCWRRSANHANQFLRANHFDDQKDKIMIFANPDMNNDTNDMNNGE